MIDYKSLRIGNWVKSGKHVLMVESIIDYQNKKVIGASGKTASLEVDFSQYEPIPLTPEILLACPEFKGGCFELNTPDRTLSFVTSPDGNYYPMLIQSPEFSNGEENVFGLAAIKHLHQLQNLFFALTGKELEIDLTKNL